MLLVGWVRARDEDESSGKEGAGGLVRKILFFGDREEEKKRSEGEENFGEGKIYSSDIPTW